ncbi:hypothetical protein HC891_15275 [Candidatus Gracilibacteria bacterium]|nr:hypothetical protein [Candidatus Gracilibacteria bacterium]
MAEDAWHTVLKRHDSFQHHFAHSAAGWEQRAGALAGLFSFSYVELFYASDSNHMAVIEANAAETQAALDLVTGPLISVVLFNRGRAKDVLLLVVHQLVADLVSAAILLDEVQLVHNALVRGATVALPPTSTPLQALTAQLHDAARRSADGASAAYWQQLAVETVVALPRDRDTALHSTPRPRPVAWSLSGALARRKPG